MEARTAQPRTNASKPVLPSAAQPAFTKAESETVKPRIGCGLPCAKCGTYYAADLALCPVCKTGERIQPHAGTVAAPMRPTEELPSIEALEEERERFLRDFKTHVYQAHMQIPTSPGLLCNREANHPDGAGAAEVCKSCFDEATQRADRVEAALHIDLQEATKIIYEAVWADTSDPTQTYRNAAFAILSELRRRAGVPEVMARSAQGYSH